MLVFLKKYNISDDVVKKIVKENSSANVYNLECNQDEAGKMIEYLSSIGITCIDELLIYRIDSFFGNLDDMKRLFSKYEVNSLVQSINNDYSIINEI